MRLKLGLAFASVLILPSAALGQLPDTTMQNKKACAESLQVDMDLHRVVRIEGRNDEVPKLVLAKSFVASAGNFTLALLRQVKTASCSIKAASDSCQDLEVRDDTGENIGWFKGCKLLIGGKVVGDFDQPLASSPKQAFEEPKPGTEQAKKSATCEKKVSEYRKYKIVRDVREFKDSGPMLVVGPDFLTLLYEQKQAVLKDVSCFISYAAPESCANFEVVDPFDHKSIGRFRDCKMELR